MPMVHFAAQGNQRDLLILAIYGQNNNYDFVSDEQAAVNIIIAYEQVVVLFRRATLERERCMTSSH